MDVEGSGDGCRLERSNLCKTYLTRTDGKPYGGKLFHIIDMHGQQYIIANLGLSKNFGPIDLSRLTFPTRMKIDYIRVYQPENAINIGCDPKDFPTEAYINECVAFFLCKPVS